MPVAAFEPKWPSTRGSFPSELDEVSRIQQRVLSRHGYSFAPTPG